MTYICVLFAAKSLSLGGLLKFRRVNPNLERRSFPATDISAPVSGTADITLECKLPCTLIFAVILGVFDYISLIVTRCSSNSSSKFSCYATCRACLFLLYGYLASFHYYYFLYLHTLEKCPGLSQKLQF